MTTAATVTTAANATVTTAANADDVTPVNTSQEDVVGESNDQTEKVARSGLQSDTITTTVTSTSMTPTVQESVPSVRNEVTVDDGKSDISKVSSQTSPVKPPPNTPELLLLSISEPFQTAIFSDDILSISET